MQGEVFGVGMEPGGEAGPAVGEDEAGDWCGGGGDGGEGGGWRCGSGWKRSVEVAAEGGAVAGGEGDVGFVWHGGNKRAAKEWKGI